MVGKRLMDASSPTASSTRRSNRFAAGLERLGVRKGDRVAIMLPNCPQFVIAAYGTWRLGAIVVCCNPLYVGREIEHLVNDSGTETFVVMSQLYERVKAVRAQTGLKRASSSPTSRSTFPVLKLLFTMAKEKKEGHRVDICWRRGHVLVPGPPAARRPERRATVEVDPEAMSRR
jgi:long-chain acyl-CoA synthetase